MKTFGSAWPGAGLFFFVLALMVGCTEDERFPELDEAPPLSPTASQLAVGVFHGDTLGLALSNPGSFQEATEVFDHGFFRLKSYDEYSVSVGEFHSHAIRADQVDFPVRGPSSFPDTGTSAARLAPRANDIVLEAERAVEQAGGGGFARHSFVVDFWRETGDWWVRWDGNISTGTNREGVGNYGFDRSDMVEDLLDHLEEIAGAHEPEWIILGDRMEKMILGGEDGAGVAPEQFDHFLEFFERARERIRGASSSTKVAAGFHWEAVAGPLAANLTGVAESDLGLEELDQTFQEVILPFAEAGDGVALRLRVNRSDADPAPYQFLRRLEQLYGPGMDLVIYSLSVPVTTTTAYRQQRLFVGEMMEHLAGVEPVVLAWERFTNIDGVETADQSVIGRCRGLTGPDSRLQMDLARCHDGLFSLGNPKEVFEPFEEFVSTD